MHLDLEMETDFRASSITIVASSADVNAMTTTGATLITAASDDVATTVVQTTAYAASA